MYVHSSRFPTSAPNSRGQSATTPWGLRRVAPSSASVLGFSYVELDPASQVARYFDVNGKQVEVAVGGSANGDDVDTAAGGDE
ncbi:putative ATP-grasp-modified RiPP [Streptomyces sp. NPDC056944]|uniref:putative ATP-grasp-modified RiPP n=1 Tax=unclassified Streptomyces TaxID=2593676 RepID=UPI003641CEA8